MRYYDTIPAANKYEVVQNTLSLYKKDLSAIDSIVGMGYGGVYLAAYAAMTMEKELLIYDYDKDNTDIQLQSGSVAFFDDFISTGKSILKAYGSMLIQNKSLAIVMYAKEHVHNLPFDIKVRCFVE